MQYEINADGCSLTMTRAELLALLGIASKDSTRPNLAGIQLDPGDRLAAVTDGHRLLVARVGASPWPGLNRDPGETAEAFRSRCTAARQQHERAQQTNQSAAEGCTVIVPRQAADAWAKAMGSGETIVLAWSRGDAPLQMRARLSSGATFTTATLPGQQFPPWRQVVPMVPATLAAFVSVRVAYLADVSKLLGRVLNSEQASLQIWTAETPTPSPYGGEHPTPNPIMLTACSRGPDDVPVTWHYLLMPIRDDAHACPWAPRPEVEPAAQEPSAPIELATAKRSRKKAAAAA